MRKVEFSKLIVGLVVLAYLYVTVYSSILMWRVCTTDGLTALIASAGTNLATVISFYMWKAKNENILKITGKTKLSISDYTKIQNGINETEV